MTANCNYATNVQKIAKILSERYEDFSHNNRKNPLEELLFVICSIQTNEDLYRAMHASLRRSFPSFQGLAEATESEIANAITVGGLSHQNAKKIKTIISDIWSAKFVIAEEDN